MQQPRSSSGAGDRTCQKPGVWHGRHGIHLLSGPAEASFGCPAIREVRRLSMAAFFPIVVQEHGHGIDTIHRRAPWSTLHHHQPLRFRCLCPVLPHSLRAWSLWPFILCARPIQALQSACSPVGQSAIPPVVGANRTASLVVAAPERPDEHRVGCAHRCSAIKFAHAQASPTRSSPLAALPDRATGWVKGNQNWSWEVVRDAAGWPRACRELSVPRLRPLPATIRSCTIRACAEGSPKI